MIMWKNSIASSNFKLLCRNWLPRKLPIIPIHVDIFMLHIFYLLNMIMRVGILEFSCCLLLFVSIVWSNNNTHLASFDKITAWSYSFSWTYMNLNIIGLSQINLGFNSFAIANLSNHLSLAFRSLTIYFTCPGDPTALSIRIEYDKKRHSRR